MGVRPFGSVVSRLSKSQNVKPRCFIDSFPRHTHTLAISAIALTDTTIAQAQHKAKKQSCALSRLVENRHLQSSRRFLDSIEPQPSIISYRCTCREKEKTQQKFRKRLYFRSNFPGKFRRKFRQELVQGKDSVPRKPVCRVRVCRAPSVSVSRKIVPCKICVRAARYREFARSRIPRREIFRDKRRVVPACLPPVPGRRPLIQLLLFVLRSLGV